MVDVAAGRQVSKLPSARAERLGVAAIIPRGELIPEVLESAARRLLTDAAVAERVEAISRRMRTQDPVASACALLAAI
jgi:UDP:flavonoid glycosyltransferase YjiC (YdhE family)